MTPHVDRYLLEFETAMDALDKEHPSELPPTFPRAEWSRLKSALCTVAKDREEVRLGSEFEGIPGCMFRFMGQTDYRQVSKWLRGEVIRNMPQACIFDTTAAAVSSIVLQVVGSLVRSNMRPAAQEVMMKAAELLEKDIKALSEMKKQGSIIRNDLRVIPGGGS